MTKTLSINEVSIQTIIALTRNGDEIVLEENGEPLAKITPIEKSPVQKQRVLGLGRGEGYFMSEDLTTNYPMNSGISIKNCEFTP